MAIIVEGFDNSGKSRLAESFGLEVIHPGPRPKTKAAEFACIKEQQENARCPVVLDRVTAISQPAYLNGDLTEYMWAIRELTETHHCVIIYCRPPIEIIQDFSKHKAKDYDSQKYVEWLQKNSSRIIGNYDRLMGQIPHLKYDWTQPDKMVIQRAYDAQFTIGAWKSCCRKS